jgi:hypothetical protein
MNSKQLLNTEIFLEAFSREWDSSTRNYSEKELQPYRSQPNWTHFILSENGFLNRLMLSLRSLIKDLEYKREYYTVDALFVAGIDLYKGNYWYPSEIHAVIEHEMGENIEEEMWKLLQWRSPLKVLIFYDWAEFEKTTELRIKWLSKKLEKLNAMIKHVNNFFSENDKTQYLFIIGTQATKKSRVEWSWASNTSLQPTQIRPRG